MLWEGGGNRRTFKDFNKLRKINKYKMKVNTAAPHMMHASFKMS